MGGGILVAHPEYLLAYDRIRASDLIPEFAVPRSVRIESRPTYFPLVVPNMEAIQKAVLYYTISEIAGAYAVVYPEL